MQMGLAFGRSLGKKIDVGVQFNYYAVRIAGYGNASAISFDAGAILHLTDQLNAGLPISNRLEENLERSAGKNFICLFNRFGLEWLVNKC